MVDLVYSLLCECYPNLKFGLLPSGAQSGL